MMNGSAAWVTSSQIANGMATADAAISMKAFSAMVLRRCISGRALPAFAGALPLRAPNWTMLAIKKLILETPLFRPGRRLPRPLAVPLA
jgi:hypothetical protein